MCLRISKADSGFRGVNKLEQVGGEICRGWGWVGWLSDHGSLVDHLKYLGFDSRVI